MKKLFTLLLCTFLFNLQAQNAYSQIRVVVLGSSTAAGVGTSGTANSWVNKYREYLKGLDSQNELINLAASGYTTYHVLPTGTTSPGNPNPDPERNITKALSLAPDVIIVNMPTNDVARSSTVSEIMSNYNTIRTLSDAQNVAVYFTTSQPRNFDGDASSTSKRQALIDLKNSTQTTYGSNSIDFWTDLANADGTIKPEYNPGDGIHLNNLAHDILYNRVKNVSSILTHARSNLATEYINLDFGDIPTNNAEWNVMTNSQNSRNNNLNNTAGAKSGIYAWVHDAFENNFSTGLTSAGSLPNDVSQDGFYGSGTNTNNPTGGITLGGLSADKKYTLSFLSSVTGNPAIYETNYSVQGQTTTEQSVNASENTSQFVVFNDVKADANGFITITVAAGANNTSPSKLFYVNSLQILEQADGPVINPGQNGRMLVDFGPTNNTTPGNWNNFTDPKGVDIRKELINTTGDLTGYKLFLHDAFNSTNTVGATNSTLYPSSATGDNFYGNNVLFAGATEPTAGVTLENLEATKKYSLTFYGSRLVNNENRDTRFTVTGSTTQVVTLQTANNVNNTVTVADMLPNANGKIVVDVTFGPANNNSYKYYHLSVMDINYAPAGTLPVKLQDFSGSYTEDGILLEWKTSSENNSSHFDVMRLENGVERVIGIVTSNGNSNTLNYYSFIDKTPGAGINYYQLNQVDANGALEKSSVIFVNTFYNLPFMAWFKSETELQLQITADKHENAQIRLTDMNGRNFYTGNLLLQDGINDNTIHFSSLPSGVYILNIIQNGNAKSLKIKKD